jgi:tetraacyldisaccharide 4'-kinase
MFPMGDLRDSVTEKKRAHIIIVTKCPADLPANEKTKIREELGLTDEQELYFTCIEYGAPYKIIEGRHENMQLNPTETDVLLVCGIANPDTIKVELTKTAHYYEMLRYPDHHIFTSNDLNEIRKQFNKMTSSHKIILTTEKDAVRLEKFGEEMKDLPIYAWPITHRFLFGEQERFLQTIVSFINQFQLSR